MSISLKQSLYTNLTPVEPSAPTTRHFHSNHKAISQISYVKVGFFTRLANAIVSIFSSNVDENKATLAIKLAKQAEEHKKMPTTTFEDKTKDHLTILKHLKEADKYVCNHWEIDLKIAQEYYDGGEYKEALVHLNKIPTKSYTIELFYFRAAVLKETGDFLEAYGIYKKLFAGKYTPIRVTKDELRDELSEMVEQWNEKPNKTPKELAAIKTFYSSDQDTESIDSLRAAGSSVEKGQIKKTSAAPEKVFDSQNYFNLSRIPCVKFDQKSESFKYLQEKIEEKDNVKIIEEALKLAKPSEKWKWQLRLAKEYDLMAKSTSVTEQQISKYLKEASAILADLETNPTLKHITSNPEFIYIQANLFWKVGDLDKARKYYEVIRSAKEGSSLGNRVLLEYPKLVHQIKERDLKLEKEDRVRDEPLVAQLNADKTVDDFMKEQGLTEKQFLAFLKRSGHGLMALRLGKKYYDSCQSWISFCPNLKLIVDNNYMSEALVEYIANGKLSQLETLDLSSTLGHTNMYLIGTNIEKLPNLKSLDMSRMRRANVGNACAEFIYYIKDKNNLEWLNLRGSDISWANRSNRDDPSLSLIPLKFPHLKSLNISCQQHTEAEFAKFMENFSTPSDIEELHLPDNVDLSVVIKHLEKFPKLKTLEIGSGKLHKIEELLNNLHKTPELTHIIFPIMSRYDDEDEAIDLSNLNNLKNLKNISRMPRELKGDLRFMANLNAVYYYFKDRYEMDFYLKNTEMICSAKKLDLYIENGKGKVDLTKLFKDINSRFPVLNHLFVSFGDFKGWHNMSSSFSQYKESLRKEQEANKTENVKTIVIREQNPEIPVEEAETAAEGDRSIVSQLNDNKPLKEILYEQKLNIVQFMRLCHPHQNQIKQLNLDNFAQHYELSLENKKNIYALISSFPHLTNLSAENSIDTADLIIELIVEGKLKELQKLNLSKNKIDDEGAIALANHLDQVPLLEALSLTDNEIGDKGVVALSDKLGPKFKEINLTNNKYGDVGKKALLGSLEEVLVEDTESEPS